MYKFPQRVVDAVIGLYPGSLGLQYEKQHSLHRVISELTLSDSER